MNVEEKQGWKKMGKLKLPALKESSFSCPLSRVFVTFERKMEGLGFMTPEETTGGFVFLLL